MVEGAGAAGKASFSVGAGLGGASRVLKASGGGVTSKGLRKGPSSAEALRGREQKVETKRRNIKKKRETKKKKSVAECCRRRS